MIECRSNRSLCFVMALSLLALAAGAVYGDETGYDENTEVIVRGQISQADAKTYKGLQSFLLKTRGRVFRVLTGPEWFVREVGLRLPVGLQVEVVGSKFYGHDGSLYLLARSIRYLPQGYTVQLRDRSCNPVWSETSRRKSSCMKIFYHPSSR